MTNLQDGYQAIQALLSGDRQTKRLLRMSFPHDDAPDAVMLANRLDAVEGLSRDFMYTVEVISENAKIALKDMQGKLVTLSVVRADGQLRHFNGYCFEFRQVRTDGSFTFYDMVLLPWLAYLRLRRDNYLFHGKNVLAQTEEIFADYDKVRDWESRITGDMPEVTDHCQWDESDYNYLHRRWEALGWHYWYEHTEKGHKLVLADDTMQAKPIDGLLPEVQWQADTGSLDEDGICDWTPVRRIAPTQVALAAFDFKKPRPVHATIPTLNQQGDVLPTEVYEYEGAYGFKTAADGDKLVRQRMMEIEANAKHFEAASNNRYVQPGRWYRLSGHYDAHDVGSGGGHNGSISSEDVGVFLVLEVRHEVNNNYLQNSGVPAYYGNKLVCTRKAVPWLPGRGFNSIEPKIQAPQTAIVVGPKGEEIHTDAYGRVKVQFHWDRIGGYDEKSSAWIRVSSSWSGKGYGFVSIPRVGQEVVVQFLDGNPDRPLVTGCVYNEDNMPPFGLPGGAHKTGLQTRSSPGGGGLCELVIHDEAGKELINILSQKDMVRTVLNNDSTVIQGPQQTIAVTTGTQATTVKKAIQVTSETEGIQHVAETAYEVAAKTQHIMLEAATDIILKVGKSSLHMSQDGTIVIDGVNVICKGSGKVDINPGGGTGGDTPMVAAVAGAAVLAMGPEAGGGAASSGPAASAPTGKPSSGGAPKPVSSGLGNDVDGLAAKSPSLQKDLQALKNDGWKIEYGKPGSGSSADRKNKSISLDGNLNGKTAAATQVLAHEVGHATYPFKADFSSKTAYVDSTLADEGAATLNNIKVQREVIAAGGSDIGVAGNSTNHAAYNKAYDQFLKDGNAASARKSIGAAFGKGETTSTTGQPYADYYGAWYDKAFPPKK